ncbi:unnamed protein product [Aphanomyces euteiches]
MRPSMQKGLQAMRKAGQCDELLRAFDEECLSDEKDHSSEWKEGFEALSKAEWLVLCEKLRNQPSTDLNTIACLTCLCWSIRDSLPSGVVTALSEVIVYLHANLLQAPPDAQDAIAQCCETYWISHAPGAEAVIPQLIPFLVVQALDGEKTSTLKRLKDVLDALSLLDFEDASSRLLKDLLLRCFVSPTFLKSNDGVQILSDLFHLDSSFTDEIHETIRNQIPMQKKSVVKRYGLIYFKARTSADIFININFHHRHPSASKEETDLIMQKQFDVMIQLVQDSAPAIRVVAVHGMSKVLSLYWELVPHEYIQQFLFWLFEMVQDVSATAVRVAVLQGLTLVLDNHLSHSVLKSLLPKLSPYLHDKQESVRAAFCQLLVRIKSIRNMHFYDIAPVDQCLNRLVLDSSRNAVVKPLTNLFLRSYFPQGVSESSQVARTLSLIEEHEPASRVFYRHVVHFSSVGAVCKLVVLLLRFLSTTDEEVPMAQGIVWVTVDLLQSIAKPLHHDKRYADCKRFLKEEIDPDALMQLLKTHAADVRVKAGLWHAISYLPFKDEFVMKALEQLAKFDCSSDKLLLVGVLQCMVQWKEETTFVETLLDQLHPKRVAKANVALLLVCVEQLLLLCDLTPLAAELVASLEKHWTSFQKQLEPASAVLYCKVVWSLHQLISVTALTDPPILLCDIWEWLSNNQNKRKLDDDVPPNDYRFELIPVLCEAMFLAMQCTTAIPFMQRMIDIAIEEPALNAQLLALIVAADVELDEPVLAALATALIEANSSSCAWLVEMKRADGLCSSIWSVLKEEVKIAHTINSSWPDHAIQNVLAVGFQRDEELPDHIVDFLKKGQSKSWIENAATSSTVQSQLRDVGILSC